ncbi:MAG: hypothetical protein K2L51_00650, partial [Clostridiales bacterium]|nr:hypothetical protein [Clostridiales bacterium]
MRNFRLVFMLQLKNMLRRDRSRSSRKTILWFALMAVAYAVVATVFIGLILEMGGVFVAFSLQAELVTLILLCGLMVVLVFCIETLLTTLYFSRDTEFFLALPVKPSTV